MRPFNLHLLNTVNPFRGKLIIESELCDSTPEEESILYETLKDATWSTWADFCGIYPVFKSMDNFMQRKMLELSPYEIPNEALINRFHRIKRVTIIAQETSEFHTTCDLYEKMITIRELHIYNCLNPITFIKSTQIERLVISAPQDTTFPPKELVGEILKISRNIREFKYSGGILDTEAIQNLQSNPIHLLILYNVEITDQKTFSWFLSNSPHLTVLILSNTREKITAWSLDALISPQASFFSEDNKSRTQILYLELYLHWRMENEYKKIIECTNLRRIKLTYRFVDDILKFYPLLMSLPNLKMVEVNATLIDPLEVGSSEEEYLFKFYMNRFRERNVTLIRTKEQ